MHCSQANGVRSRDATEVIDEEEAAFDMEGVLCSNVQVSACKMTVALIFFW